ncbi:hypothetical protein KCP71_17545 [Salmonella enterica subsp. enterica]|nr:hypothetical protein KCP71_17545 [Salmonella enterica subsp. enterica]
MVQVNRNRTSLPPLPAGPQVLSVSDNQPDQPAAVAGRTGVADAERNPQLVRLPPLPEGTTDAVG